MGLTREESYEILELPVGVDQDSIRTSYKRLALKWHPDKHSGSQDALTKFKLVSKSYKRLTTGENTDDMTLDQMLSLFKEVFFTRQVNSYNGSGYDSSDDDDDEDIEEEVKYSNLFPDKIKLKQDWKKAREEGDIMGKKLSAEEISRNAEELITEEEKEKRRAEKRRAKKKRRRDKKKQEKQDTDIVEPQEEKKSSKQKIKEISETVPEKNKKPDMMGDASTSSDEAGFDPNSAFFTKVVNKKKKSPLAVDSQPARQRKDKGEKSEEESEELDPKTLRSRQLAIKGNEMAHLGHYNAAIELFSEAIKLDPKDFRFFGNRSYCYDRIQQYEKALKDAEKAISLAKDWPKGYFRQGRALAGLKMFPEAEQAFTQVLKLDKNCKCCSRTFRVRTLKKIKNHKKPVFLVSMMKTKKALLYVISTLNVFFVYSSNGTITIGSAVRNPQKQSGPVNGNECYFWRTTGCTYGDKCRNSHIPAHKGVDRKPWQRDQ
ncbi:uncharacterized protein LOC123546690 [Mercenaria mercenaria]|uniref:uncharacterized protein LOC123546690 n=1 Tax=Mercenaria mercenaria TaxID=6596 RepID=UPI00234F952C|nr:uncharacterized protein LOC123546690 [Mercenaria mercenaria]